MVTGREREKITKSLCEIHIKKINEGFDSIYTQTRDVFKTESEDLANLFDLFWGKCRIPLGLYITWPEYIKYFSTFLQDLDKYIDDCYLQFEIDDVNRQNKKVFFRAIVQVCFLLTKQQFYLSQLKNINYLENFIDEINQLKRVCRFNTNGGNILKGREEKNKTRKSTLDSLHEMTYQLQNTLQKKGYPIEVVDVTQKKHESFLTEYAQNVINILSSLPEANALNFVMSQMEEAVKNENKEAMKEGVEKINNFIVELERAKNNLEVLFNCNQPIIQEMLNALIEENEFINSFISLASKTSVLEVTNILAQMSGSKDDANGFEIFSQIAEQFRVACDKQGSKSFIKKNPWQELCLQVNNSLITISTDLKKFTDSYRIYNKDVQEIELAFKVMKEDQTVLIDYAMQFGGEINKLKISMQLALNAITETQKRLHSYLVETKPYLLRFFSNHWLEMMIGAVVGNASTIWTIFCFADPTKLSLLITAATLSAGGIGAAIGLVRDEYFKKPAPLPFKEKQLVAEESSSKEQTQEPPAKSSKWALMWFHNHSKTQGESKNELRHRTKTYNK